MKDFVSYPDGLKRCKYERCEMYTTDVCKICGCSTCSTHRAIKNEVTGEVVCKGCLGEYVSTLSTMNKN